MTFNFNIGESNSDYKVHYVVPYGMHDLVWYALNPRTWSRLKMTHDTVPCKYELAVTPLSNKPSRTVYSNICYLTLKPSEREQSKYFKLLALLCRFFGSAFEIEGCNRQPDDRSTKVKIQ